MTDEPTTPVDPHAGGTGNPQPDAATTSTDPHAGDSPSGIISLEEARKIRSESTNLRKRLKDAETLAAELKQFKEQIEASQLSEQEKRDNASKKLTEQLAALQKERDDALTQAKAIRVNSAIQLHAIQQGIDPKLAARLLDTSALEFDETTGNPTNLDKAFKAMMEEFGLDPKKSLSSGGATNPSSSQTSGAGEITEQYVQDVMSGKIDWKTLTKEQKTKINQWQAQHAYKF